ncbi:hypothetical protein [Halomonas sp. E19]|uniref:hypothetical protein n=1 Tax=Halomonas sp. E19 TaxID=3397247 RepID=UPI0040332327
MSPGPNNAAKGSRLLKLLSEGVRCRADTARKRVGVSDYNSVVMSYGARLFEKLNGEINIDEIWKSLREEKYILYLTDNEANNFSAEDFPDAESPTYPRLVKKVLGGKFLEEVYDAMHPVMES